MRFLKKLFSKRKEPIAEVNLKMPFNFKKVRLREKYLVALLAVIEEEFELDNSQINEEFYLEFGDHSGIHILYFSIGDLYILMEPENDNWKSSKAYVARMVGDKERFEENGFKFLFRIANSCYGEPNDIDLEWSEYAYVYSSD